MKKQSPLLTVLSLLLSLLVVSCYNKPGEGIPLPGNPAHTERNVAYGSDPLQKMDVYFPENYTTETPVVFFFHGGGFVEGDKDGYAAPCSLFLEEKFIVVNTNYRLMDSTGLHANPVGHRVSQIKLYDAVVDARAAVNKFKALAGEWKAGTGKMYMAGHSAGAILSLLFLHDKTQNPAGDIRAVANYGGTSDLTLPPGNMQDYLDPYLNPQQAAYLKELYFRWTGKEMVPENELAYMAISPYWVTYNWIQSQQKTGRPVLSVMPQFNDPFPLTSPISSMRNVQNYHAYLTSQKVPNQLIVINGENHGWGVKPDSWSTTVQATAAFFRQH